MVNTDEPGIEPGMRSHPTSVAMGRPRLPGIEKLSPFLERIWKSGRASNNGPMLQEFELCLEEILDWPNPRVTSSGTAALMLAFKALGMDHGEVIVPAFAFPAVAQALAWNGCRPVAVDVTASDLNLDPAAAEAAITSRTTGIVAVHTFGHPADVDSLSSVARRHQLPIVFDAAGATGVRVHGQSVARFGDASAFSFHATKVLTTLEGGAITTTRSDVARLVGRLRNFGMLGDDAPHEFGLNAKMNEIQAAIGILALDDLRLEIVLRSKVAQRYTQRLAHCEGLEIIASSVESEPNYAYMALRVRRGRTALADDCQRALAAAGFDSRRYFSGPYRAKVICAGPLHVSVAAWRDVLCLPIWGEMPLDQVDQICEVIEETLS